MYYLQSRYYNSEVGRFINGDDPAYLGVAGILSYNLFAYCDNNPVTGYDPVGEWNWGGVVLGLAVVAVVAVSVATFGVGSGLGAVVAAAAVTTGTTMTYAAATDSAMVIDVSLSYQKEPILYGKLGVSLVIDFGADGGIYSYTHKGFGCGVSCGLTYSTGLVDNFNYPTDYSGHFTGVSGGNTLGIDHCFNPVGDYSNATKATSVTFGNGISAGAGYDYYSDPFVIKRWRSTK